LFGCVESAASFAGCVDGVAFVDEHDERFSYELGAPADEFCDGASACWFMLLFEMDAESFHEMCGSEGFAWLEWVGVGELPGDVVRFRIAA
jgi:hypothetical protein